MSVSTEQRICGFLNQYLFQNIWNEPFREFRTNVRLRLQTSRAVTGTYRARYDVIPLPNSTEPFIVYSMPLEQTASFNIDCPDWVKFSDWNAKHLLDFQIYDYRGIWLWREGVYIRQGAVRNSFLIAVSRPMLLKCVGSADKFKEMFVTKYYDSDLIKDLSAKYFHITTGAQRYTAFESFANATTIFVNGRWAQPTAATELKIGDYVEVIRDGNVMGKILIDLDNPDMHHTYLSTEENITKTIVHIPKAMNPEGEFITWNTCDVLVRPKNITNANNLGMFMHKLDRKWVYQQLTHSDFAIDSRIYDTYREYFGDTGLAITILIRSHNKNNRVVRDINYIDLLYLHDDDTIIKFFQGKGPANFEFWTADHLEDSVYGQAMYDVPDIYRPKDLGYYIDVLGYNNTLALICDRTKRFVINRYNQRVCWNVSVPLLFLDAPLRAIVYRNGLKVNDKYVQIVMNSELTAYIQVVDDNGEVIVCEKGDEYVIELFENPSKFDIIIDEVTEANATMTLSTDDIFVWKKTNSGYVRDINGNQIQTYASERVTEFGDLIQNETTGLWTLTLSPELYTHPVAITAGNGMYKLVDKTFDVTFEDFELITSGPLKVDIPHDINLAGQIEYLVYFNGHALTKDLGYKVVVNKVGNNEIFTEIVLQDISWLQESDNHLEIYGVRGEMRGLATGWVSGGEVTAPGEAPFWFDNLSMLFVDGRSIVQLESVFGQIFVRSVGHRNGSPYLMRTLVSAGAIAAMDKYRNDIDTERLLRLRDYFVEKTPPVGGLDVIPFSHRIFSIFTNSIIRDILKGTLVATDNPNDEIFMEQFNGYTWLKRYDTAYGDIDLDYVDIYPMFHRTTVDDKSIYLIMEHLMKAALPKDGAQYRDTVYE